MLGHQTENTLPVLVVPSSGASLHCFQCHVVIYDRFPICRYRYYFRTYYGRRLKLFHTPQVSVYNANISPNPQALEPESSHSAQ